MGFLDEEEVNVILLGILDEFCVGNWSLLEIDLDGFDVRGGGCCVGGIW